MWAASGPPDESQLGALSEGKDFRQQSYYLLASYDTPILQNALMQEQKIERQRLKRQTVVF